MSFHHNLPRLENIGILVLDNDISHLRLLKRSLTELGAQVFLAGDIVEAYRLVNRELLHAVLAEAQLKQGNSFDLMKRFVQKVPSGLCFLMSATIPGPTQTRIQKEGIDHFFPKPVDIAELASKFRIDVDSRMSAVSRLDPLTALLRPYLVFRSPVMRRGLMMLPTVAASPHSVLITGETGTGKEMVARAIHGLSPFADGPFVAVNCGAIPESLIEGELFGHERGAFTGAQSLRRGKFELAQGGTLLLDEMGEMPLALQSRLLRALEERQFYRVGGEKPIKVDIRIVAATQVNLEKAVKNGLFREDLYYRLNVLRIHIPPLRKRLEDIPLLAWHFLERAFSEVNRRKPYPILADETIAVLKKMDWEGNVRELRNMLTRLAVMLPPNVDRIVPDCLIAYFPEKGFPGEVASPHTIYDPGIVDGREEVIEVDSYSHEEGVFIPMGIPMKEVENRIIQATLQYTGGNRTKAAKILGLGLRTIRRKINEPTTPIPRTDTIS